MPKVELTLETHKRKWSSCKDCRLCDLRSNVVFYRGKLPCEVLFIGEAPGASEDIIGEPFVGPAGHLLEEMIDSVQYPLDISIGFTNIVACIPKDENNNKTHKPDEESIIACSARLKEIVELAQPSKIVAVGVTAKEWIPKLLDDWQDVPSIVHPAALLRADPQNKPLQIKKCKIAIAEIFDSLIPF